MPTDYEHTVGKLQNFITDDEICAILCSDSTKSANKLMVDCLINRMQNKKHLLDLCNHLELVCPSQDMHTITEDIKSGMYMQNTIHAKAEKGYVTFKKAGLKECLQ